MSRRLGRKHILGDTSGYKGWRPLRQIVAHNDDGSPESIEVYRNIMNNEIHRDLNKGWNSEPPYPTGDLSQLRHKAWGGTAELWESFRKKALADAAQEGSQPPLWTRRDD